MPTRTHVRYDPFTSVEDNETTVLIVGRKARLRDGDWSGRLGLSDATWAAILERTSAGDLGGAATTWVGARKLIVGVLPEPCSRHNTPTRAWAIPDLARRVAGKTDAAVILLVDEPSHAAAAALATARGLPLFRAKSGEVHEQRVRVCAFGPSGPITDPEIQSGIDGVRLAARLVDTPACELHTDAFVEEARAVAERTGSACTVIDGEALREGGLGGLWGVGKAATHKPALVHLFHDPEGATRSVAWIGKGIVYDTGGLSIKSRTGMPGMKGDMGGAAAILGAFATAATRGVDYRIHAILCLAENSVGPDATRPDDILHMRSGKTVEVNNTDAEGRLVLADGVAWAAAETDADLIIDVATLTGAALVTAGRVHSAIYCNDAIVEAAAVVAGKAIGEPCFPLLYAPELLRKEYKSHVADMKNSVKDRANAQCSCAAQFVGNHLPTPAPRWLHIDIAGPAWDSDNRGTGYGVGLLTALGAGPAPAS